MIEPGDHSSVGILGAYPFFDPYEVSKLFRQTSAIEFVRESVPRHQRPREIYVTRLTHPEYRVLFLYLQPIRI